MSLPEWAEKYEKKIRELEAELAKRRDEYFHVVRERQDFKARAKKAEEKNEELKALLARRIP